MQCPHCDARLRIAPADYSALNSHLHELACAYEQRGDRLRDRCEDLRAEVLVLEGILRDKDAEFGKQLDLIATLRNRIDDLRQQLAEFKDARKSVRSASNAAPIRRVA